MAVYQDSKGGHQIHLPVQYMHRVTLVRACEEQWLLLLEIFERRALPEFKIWKITYRPAGKIVMAIQVFDIISDVIGRE